MRGAKTKAKEHDRKMSYTPAQREAWLYVADAAKLDPAFGERAEKLQFGMMMSSRGYDHPLPASIAGSAKSIVAEYQTKPDS